MAKEKKSSSEESNRQGFYRSIWCKRAQPEEY